MLKNFFCGEYNLYQFTKINPKCFKYLFAKTHKLEAAEL